jgi:LysM repeat protein
MDKWVIAFSILVLLGLWLFFGDGIHTFGKAKDVFVQLLPSRMTPVAQNIALAPTPTLQTIEPTIVIPTPTSVSAVAAPTVMATSTLSSTATPTATPEIIPTPTVTETATEAPTLTSTPTETATPKPQPGVYVVKAGDTLITIAQQVDRDVDALAAYNKISDPTTIYVGQKLQIPPANYTPPTPTPKRPTKTPTPTHTPTPSITLPAPTLLNPGDRASYGGADAFIELVWQPLTTGIPEGAEYVVHIGVQVGPNNQVDWRLTEAVGNNTSFVVPGWLFGQAPQTYGRAYFWYIQVANVTRVGDQIKMSPISEPSYLRRFFWN